jgi:hypothetical protein
MPWREIWKMKFRACFLLRTVEGDGYFDAIIPARKLLGL